MSPYSCAASTNVPMGSRWKSRRLPSGERLRGPGGVSGLAIVIIHHRIAVRLRSRGELVAKNDARPGSRPAIDGVLARDARRAWALPSPLTGRTGVLR